ncbi:hypothetical protein F4780DRAFT_478222 [Xylariomycetidae sp. FL0641]|nr:hypothetical protein F4780DRAFT_478222 [Xylariomycetidae sp. FL0641]
MRPRRLLGKAKRLSPPGFTYTHKIRAVRSRFCLSISTLLLSFRSLDVFAVVVSEQSVCLPRHLTVPSRVAPSRCGDYTSKTRVHRGKHEMDGLQVIIRRSISRELAIRPILLLPSPGTTKHSFAAGLSNGRQRPPLLCVEVRCSCISWLGTFKIPLTDELRFPLPSCSSFPLAFERIPRL